MKIAAQILSFLFHPLSLPVYAYLIFHHSDPFFNIHFNPELNLQFLSIFIFNTFVAPLLAILFLFQNGTINSLSDPNKKSRIIVALTVLILYVFTYVLFGRFNLPSVFYDLFLSIIITILLGGLITMWYKISMHGIGMGGLLGAQCALFSMHDYFILPLLLLLIILVGIVGTARLIIKAHSHNQVYLGSLLGFSSMGLLLLFF